MADQQLKDHIGRLLGTIKTLPSGRQELRDHSGRFKGFFDPKSNETRDVNNRLYGKGNQLTRLL